MSCGFGTLRLTAEADTVMGYGKLANEDIALFRAEVGDVKPLPYDRHVPAIAPPAPRARWTRADEQEVLELLAEGDFDPGSLESGEALSFARSGLQHQLLRKLGRGQFRIGAELDLHGLTVPLARAALGEFLHDCRARDIRCVRIVHGKGLNSHLRGPVLKTKVNRWLAQRDEVLAFCSARPVDGGSGAVYVLLKRLR